MIRHAPFYVRIATSSRKTGAKKEDDDDGGDEPAGAKIKKDEESGDDSDVDDNEKEMHDIDVRDVKYKMEILGDWIQNRDVPECFPLFSTRHMVDKKILPNLTQKGLQN